MPRFYQPDLTANLDSPFIRDGNDKLIRRSYWLDMDDRTLVMVMTNGIGANLTNEEKRTHLTDLRREHLIDKVCIQEILPLTTSIGWSLISRCLIRARQCGVRSAPRRWTILKASMM